jgi:hypothetical protein
MLRITKEKDLNIFKETIWHAKENISISFRLQNTEFWFLFPVEMRYLVVIIDARIAIVY